MPGSSKWFIFLRFSHKIHVCTSPLLHTCYMSRSFHSSQFSHLNNSGWWVLMMKLLIIEFSPLPCYLVPVRPTYSP
jgi:hypothetical protein